MPIEFNLFKPAYNNLLVPLAHSLVQPYTQLVNDSAIPLYRSVTGRGQSYQEGVEKFNSMIKTIELVGQIALFFFVYQKGWNFGVHYLGLLGGAGACAAIYGIGWNIDQILNTRINDIFTGTWLYYKGLTTLVIDRNLEGPLAALLVGGFLGLRHQESSQKENSWDANRLKAAERLASFFGYASTPQNNSSSNLVDRPQDLPDGKRV